MVYRRFLIAYNSILPAGISARLLKADVVRSPEISAVKLPTGYTLDWAGKYESAKRSQRRLLVVSFQK